MFSIKKNVVILCLIFSQQLQANTSIGVDLSNAIINRYTPTIDSMTHHGWDHSNSAILHGMEKVYLKSKNPIYVSYIKKYADDFINIDGSINGLLTTLDGIHPSVLCLFLYQQTGDEKYKLAAKTMRDHLIGNEKHPSVFSKTPDGGYWHKNNNKYKNVMSVDGLYMASPFLVHYGVMFNDQAAIDIAVEQILLISERSFNIKYKLPYHAWNYDKTKPWANRVTGTASQFWSRASGWYAMALIDVLEFLPKEHAKYPTILSLYQDLVIGLKNVQNPDNGFWYHILDQYKDPKNYPESSSTGMIIYAIQKGVNRNLLDPSYTQIAQTGWHALKVHIKEASDGGPKVISVAPGMGAQNTYEGYLAIRPVTVPSKEVKQHAHGYIGVLMAASVMESY